MSAPLLPHLIGRPRKATRMQAVREVGKALLAVVLITSSAALACLLLSLPHVTTH